MHNVKESIAIVKEQIDKFDNKASSLIAIVSIVFTLSLNMLSFVNELEQSLDKNFTIYIHCMVFFSLYCIAFALEIIFLVLVIYPRKDKNQKQKSSQYYLNLAKMSEKEIASTLAQNSESSNIEQLGITAKICATKHKYLVCSIWTLIPLVFMLFAMCFLIFF